MIRSTITTFIISTSICFSQNLLKEKLEKIKEDYQVPGLAAAIIKDGKMLDIQSVGIKKAGYKEKLTVEDKFHLGSNTKSMTATLAAILIEKDLLSWDSKLSDLLPSTKLHSDFQDVTFELLLSHRSGLTKDITNFTDDPEVYNLFSILNSGTLSAYEDRDLTASYILSKPANFKAKKEFKYSNLGYIVAGHILERLTKSTWENLIRIHLFEPLAMKSCGFGETSNKQNDVPLNTWGHKPFNGKNYSIHADNAEYLAPAGRVHCNLKDWGKYLMVHLKGLNNKSKFLKAKSFKKLHKLYPQEGSEHTFGGWVKTNRTWANGEVLTHSGSNTYNFARTWVIPHKNTIIMTTSNISQAQGYKSTDEAVGALIDLYLK